MPGFVVPTEVATLLAEATNNGFIISDSKKIELGKACSNAFARCIYKLFCSAAKRDEMYIHKSEKLLHRAQCSYIEENARTHAWLKNCALTTVARGTYNPQLYENSKVCAAAIHQFVQLEKKNSISPDLSESVFTCLKNLEIVHPVRSTPLQLINIVGQCVIKSGEITEGEPVTAASIVSKYILNNLQSQSSHIITDSEWAQITAHLRKMNSESKLLLHTKQGLAEFRALLAHIKSALKDVSGDAEFQNRTLAKSLNKESLDFEGKLCARKIDIERQLSDLQSQLKGIDGQYTIVVKQYENDKEAASEGVQEATQKFLDMDDLKIKIYEKELRVPILETNLKELEMMASKFNTVNSDEDSKIMNRVKEIRNDVIAKGTLSDIRGWLFTSIESVRDEVDTVLKQLSETLKKDKEQLQLIESPAALTGKVNKLQQQIKDLDAALADKKRSFEQQRADASSKILQLSNERQEIDQVIADCKKERQEYTQKLKTMSPQEVKNALGEYVIRTACSDKNIDMAIADAGSGASANDAQISSLAKTFEANPLRVYALGGPLVTSLFGINDVHECGKIESLFANPSFQNAMALGKKKNLDFIFYQVIPDLVSPDPQEPSASAAEHIKIRFQKAIIEAKNVLEPVTDESGNGIPIDAQTLEKRVRSCTSPISKRLFYELSKSLAIRDIADPELKRKTINLLEKQIYQVSNATSKYMPLRLIVGAFLTFAAWMYPSVTEMNKIPNITDTLVGIVKSLRDTGVLTDVHNLLQQLEIYAKEKNVDALKGHMKKIIDSFSKLLDFVDQGIKRCNFTDAVDNLLEA